MIDSEKRNLIAHQLHLGTLTTVDQNMPVINIQILRGRKPSPRGQSPARSKYGKLDTHCILSGLNLIKKARVSQALVIKTVRRFLIFVFHVFFDLMHEHGIDTFFYCGQYVQYTVQLRYLDEFHGMI
jgi:hypothetical protein